MFQHIKDIFTVERKNQVPIGWTPSDSNTPLSDIVWKENRWQIWGRLSKIQNTIHFCIFLVGSPCFLFFLFSFLFGSSCQMIHFLMNMVDFLFIPFISMLSFWVLFAWLLSVLRQIHRWRDLSETHQLMITLATSILVFEIIGFAFQNQAYLQQFCLAILVGAFAVWMILDIVFLGSVAPATSPFILSHRFFSIYKKRLSKNNVPFLGISRISVQPPLPSYLTNSWWDKKERFKKYNIAFIPLLLFVAFLYVSYTLFTTFLF